MSGMPTAEQGKHFQMWAIADGKPQSLGMVNLQSVGGLQEFECVPSAVAYAISVEDKPEGNPTPTVVLMSGALVEEGE